MNKLFLVFFVLFLFSCSNNRPSSSNIIPRDTLISLIVDLHIADVILLNPNVQSKISDISSNKLYQTILNNYHISKERFKKSMDYYASSPETLDSIYDIVIERLNLIESRWLTDSLSNL